MEDIFEKIARKEIPSEGVYEDEDVYAFLDIKPNNLGHTLVIPKKRYKNIYDAPAEVLQKMIVAAQKIALAQKKTLGAEGVNIVMNNESAAGQIVFHIHMHVIPRFKGDGFEHWHGTTRTEEEMKLTAEKIRACI